MSYVFFAIVRRLAFFVGVMFLVVSDFPTFYHVAVIIVMVLLTIFFGPSFIWYAVFAGIVNFAVGFYFANDR